MQYLRLHTHPKLHTHQCGAHIRCTMNQFICSYAVVEAPYPSKAACTSMWCTYKVYYEPVVARRANTIIILCEGCKKVLTWLNGLFNGEIDRIYTHSEFHTPVYTPIISTFFLSPCFSTIDNSTYWSKPFNTHIHLCIMWHYYHTVRKISLCTV